MGWSSQVTTAQIVIVSGPTGVVSGVFVYEPGTTPAAGNPPIAGLTASSTDPYGNAIPHPGLFAQTQGGNSFYLLLSPLFEGVTGLFFGTRAAAENPTDGAAGIFQILNTLGGGAQSAVTRMSGTELKSPNGSFVSIDYFSAASDGSFTAEGVISYTDNAGTEYDLALWGVGGFFISVCNHLQAQDPSVTTKPQAEVWHPISLPGGLTGTLRCRQAAESNFAIYDVNVNFAYSTSAQTFTCGSAPAPAAQPSAYYPAGTQRLYGLAVNGAPSGITASVPRLFIPAGSGAIQVIVPAGTGATAQACGTFWVPTN